MNTTIGYTPKHAKPGSPSDATGSGTPPAAVTAPSTGRHAAPETGRPREGQLAGARAH